MRFLPIIERYVLRQIARPMFTALTVGLLVLIAERLVRLLDITMGKKNSFTVVAELLSYWLPHYAGLAAPMGLYIGLIYGLSRMSADSELDAILASGVGLHQLTRPVMVIAAFLAMFALAMFGWAQPYAQYAYRSLLYTINNIDVFYLAEEGVFMQADTRTFMLDKLKRGDNAFERIFLFDYRGKGGSETLTAERGRWCRSRTTVDQCSNCKRVSGCGYRHSRSSDRPSPCRRRASAGSTPRPVRWGAPRSSSSVTAMTSVSSRLANSTTCSARTTSTRRSATRWRASSTSASFSQAW